MAKTRAGRISPGTGRMSGGSLRQFGEECVGANAMHCFWAESGLYVLLSLGGAYYIPRLAESTCHHGMLESGHHVRMRL